MSIADFFDGGHQREQGKAQEQEPDHLVPEYTQRPYYTGEYVL